ncbi:hypothetical protein MRX96_013345 [Rhipicephalus microplus]
MMASGTYISDDQCGCGGAQKSSAAARVNARARVQAELFLWGAQSLLFTEALRKCMDRSKLECSAKGGFARPAQHGRRRISTSVPHVNAPCGIRRATTAPMQRFLKRLLRRGPRKVAPRARRTVRRAPSNIRGNAVLEPLPLKQQADKGCALPCGAHVSEGVQAGREEQLATTWATTSAA